MDEEISNKEVNLSLLDIRTIEKLEQFSNERWVMLESADEITSEQHKYPVGKRKRSFDYGKANIALDAFFTNEIWTFILDSWNKHLEDAKTTGNGTRDGKIPKINTQRSMKNFKVIKEVKSYVGCMILMTLTQKDNKEHAYQEVNSLYPNLLLPAFTNIKNKLHFLRFSSIDLQTFANMISDTALSIHQIGQFVCQDELLIPDISENIVGKVSKKKRIKNQYLLKSFLMIDVHVFICPTNLTKMDY
jgi:hypothetical protein